MPLRAAGAQLIQDLHPADRGPQSAQRQGDLSNGNPYCPATPRPLLELGPLARAATGEDPAAHDTSTAAGPAGLGKITADDAEGYHRVACPAATGGVRCPLRPDSMTRDRARPEILTPPEHPPACCTQETITVAPGRRGGDPQKHDYPSAAHRRSYARRTGAERGSPRSRTPPPTPSARGWCRLMGLTPLALWLAALHTIRNQRILRAWDARQAENTRRAAAGLPPRTANAAGKPPWPASPRRPNQARTPRHSPPLTSTRQPALHAQPSQQPHPQPPTGHAGQGKQDQLRPRSPGPEMSDLNVNMVPTET